MINYKLYLERRERNPLRKRELEKEQVPSHIDVYKTELNDIVNSKKFQDTYKLLKIRDPKAALEYFKDTEQKLKDKYLRTTVSKKNFIKLVINGIEFNINKKEKFLNTPLFSKVEIELEKMVPKFLEDIKGILPLRRPKIIITQITDNVGYDPTDDVPAYYQDKVIYLNAHDILEENYGLLVHEYAHFIADSIPAETYPMLQQEYQNMLDEYYRQMKKKKTYILQDTGEENYFKIRTSIARKFGWPSEYTFNNPDELFAEIITYWKRIPSNAITYKFKTAVKNVINRLSGSWDVKL
jgi:hypothetical protein